jgi:hypothetical protein
MSILSLRDMACEVAADADDLARFIRNKFSDLRSPEKRALIHRANFFNAIRPWQEKRMAEIAHYVEGSNATVLQYFISRDIMGDVFSYSGYEETALIRDQSERNPVVAELIDQSLEESGPATIIDFGTYDRTRMNEIIGLVKNKKSIYHIVGVDINDLVNDAFDNSSIPGTSIHTDVRMLAPFLVTLPGRKIYLGLENIMMNLMESKLMAQDLSLGPFLSQLMLDEDTLIMENVSGIVYNTIPDGPLGFGIPPKELARMEAEQKNFYETIKATHIRGVERMFKEYYERTGLQDLVGGELQAHDDPELSRKLILVHNPKEYVQYMDEEFLFLAPEFTIESIAGPIRSSVLSDPLIHLGESKAVTSDDVFETLITLYLFDLVLDSASDWRVVDNHNISKLTMRSGSKVHDSELEHHFMRSLYASQQAGVDPVFHNFTDTMVGLGLYPEHYNALLGDYDAFLRGEGKSPAVKYFLKQRRDDGARNNNMIQYLPRLFAGQEKEVHYDAMEELFSKINLTSFIKVNGG